MRAAPHRRTRASGIVTKIYLVLAFSLSASIAAHADPIGNANPHAVVADTLSAFERQAAAVRDGMQPGGVYGYIESADRARVEERLASMQRLLEGHAEAATLPQNDKLALLNTQEELNA